MVDDFEVEEVFGERQHKRSQFKFIIDDRKYTGYYHDGEIQWMHPHPKQDVGEIEVKAVEAEVLELLSDRGIRKETESIEVEPMLKNHTRSLQKFKLKIQGEEFVGTLLNGNIEWFHPKPTAKLNADRMKSVEENVKKRIEEESE